MTEQEQILKMATKFAKAKLRQGSSWLNSESSAKELAQNSVVLAKGIIQGSKK